MCDVILEDGGDIFLFPMRTHSNQCAEGYSYLWKITLTITDQQAGFSTASIPNNDKLLGIRGGFCYIGRSRHGAHARSCAGTRGAGA